MQIGLTLMAERFTLKVKLQDLLQCGQYCDLYYSVDYGSSVPKKYCRYYVVRYRHRCHRFLLALFIGLRSRKNAASLAKGKSSGWVMQYSFQVMQDLTDK
ncbi:hypothetical protein BANRA_00028 [Escherichia coli]|nr:hypothetical protein BANRA_00028 [Escherichia coli]